MFTTWMHDVSYVMHIKFLLILVPCLSLLQVKCGCLCQVLDIYGYHKDCICRWKWSTGHILWDVILFYFILNDKIFPFENIQKQHTTIWLCSHLLFLLYSSQCVLEHRRATIWLIALRDAYLFFLFFILLSTRAEVENRWIQTDVVIYIEKHAWGSYLAIVVNGSDNLHTSCACHQFQTH